MSLLPQIYAIAGGGIASLILLHLWPRIGFVVAVATVVVAVQVLGVSS